MKNHFIKELEHCKQILEFYYHDMMEIEFTIEKGKTYILSAHEGKRKDYANLKIVLSMFCENKISINDIFKKLPYQQIIKLLDVDTIANDYELEVLAYGIAASSGTVAAKICYSLLDAEGLIERKENFIFCQPDLSPDTINIVFSKYCKGVIAVRGGVTCHAAVICRGINKPCIVGADIFSQERNLVDSYDGQVTIDGNTGKIYAGAGRVMKAKNKISEVEMLYDLLLVVIKCNIVTSETAALVWRLWDVIVSNKRYVKNNVKELVEHKTDKFISFRQPSQKEIEDIYSKLQYVENASLLVEDFIGFLLDEISRQVPLGKHFLYFRPTLNPVEMSGYGKDNKYIHKQLTGIEFFHINRFVDFLLDIYSIRIYFSTELSRDDFAEKNNDNILLNYLDYTNPNGESLIINNYNVDKVALYINDAYIQAEQIPIVYHLIRRRRYHWTWYQDHDISKKEITDYLKAGKFQRENNVRLYALCDEIHLVKNEKLTLAGQSLIGGISVEKSKNIDYILEQVLLRGYEDKPNEYDDFSKLIQRKDFKNLISLELYEYYFFNERHEFDLQLLNEVIDYLADYFSNPEILKQIENGLLQNLPSAIIISLVSSIEARFKAAAKKKRKIEDEDSYWTGLKKNTIKIEKEFSNHDYILTEEIERIFGESREKIQPLLKLCGCRCYIYKGRSIWIKAGTDEERIKEILRMHHFKIKK